MINEIEANVVFKINNIENIGEEYIQEFITEFLKNDEYEPLKNLYHDKEKLRNLIDSLCSIAILMNLLFKIYSEYVNNLYNLKKD